MIAAKKIGIVGGGQLGMMLAEAAQPLRYDVTVIESKQDCPASFAGAKVLTGKITDKVSILQLAGKVDVTTIEIEHINVDALIELENRGLPVHPSPGTLEIIKDKYAQKVFLKNAGIPTAEFLPIDTNKDFAHAGSTFGYPFVLKARHGAYDGRGNERVHDENDIARAKEKLGDTPLYAEKFVPFVKELAVMVARSTTGEVKTYPVVETIHEEDILRYTLAPAEIDDASSHKAKSLATQVIKHLQGAGVFGVEMFLTKDGGILVNEIAPRVHNSGHYTIEACLTSQFTQHLLAISGQPLGETHMISDAAVMVNILGDKNPRKTMHIGEQDGLENVFIHGYHKDPRPLRKIGHITVLRKSVTEARRIADEALEKTYYE